MFYFILLEPWSLIESDSRKNSLEAELRKEVGKKHILFGRSAKALATRSDQDDVLFETGDTDKKYAVVHLTWGAHPDPFSNFPSTEIYEGLDAWKEQMIIDSEDYNS